MATEPLPGDRRDVSAGAPLVGRDEDLARLLDALKRAPSVVIVEGEAGVGKSRLVAEALDALGSAGPVLIGSCHPLPEPFPLGPVIEALQEAIVRLPGTRLANPLLGALRPLFPEAGDRLPPPPEPLAEAGAERHRLFRAIAAAIEALDPRVLVFEDVHWSDRATLDLLTLLVPALDGDRSVVLTSRPEEVASPRGLAAATRPRRGVHREVIGLAPLESEGTRRLTMSLLGSEEISEEFTNYLFERTGGVPFALEELLRLLQDRGDLVLTGDRWARRELTDIHVPAAIRDSVLERVDRLSRDARLAVRAAAVLRVPSDEHLLAATAGMPEQRAAAALSSAVRAALLQERPGGRMAFRHGLAEQAVHDSIPSPERRRLHLRAGHALEAADPTQVAALAEHFREAGESDAASRYAEQAADAASALFDDRAAARFLRSALDLTPLGSVTRARIAAKLGDAALHGLAHREAADVLRGIVEEEGLPPTVRGELRFNLGRLLLQSGDASAAAEQFRAAVPELRGAPALQARTMASLGYPWVREGQLQEHVAWLDRAAAVAATIDDPEARLAVQVDRASVLLHVGRPAGWKAILEIGPDDGSPEAARQRARAACNLCEAAIILGHYEHAERFASECREIAEAHGYRRPLGLLGALEVALDFERGRWEGISARARALADQDGRRGQIVVARLVRGLHALAEGRLDDAGDELADVLEIAEREGDWAEMAQAAGGVARIRLAANDAAGALEVAMRALEVLRSKAIWAWSTDAVAPGVEALLQLGRDDEAAALVKEMAGGLKGSDAPAAKAALAGCRAAVALAQGNGAAAARGFATAERMWRSLPNPYEAARSLESRGTALGSSNVELSRKLQLRALKEYEGFGAAGDAARLRGRLRMQGVAFGHRRGRRGYGDELSPREREIAGLAALGRTNREIAERLYLSVRTVEAHVARILRKVGAETRRDLVDLVGDRPDPAGRLTPKIR